MSDSPLASAEWLALVAAMRFAPDDDTPRHAAADWLQEQGVPELTAWGQFVTVQLDGCRAKRDHKFTDSCDCKACSCERRATLLYDRWSLSWWHHAWPQTGLIPVNPPADRYSRGFVKTATAQHTGDAIKTIPKLIQPMFERQPITTAMLHVYHTHPTRVPDRFVIGVVVKPSTIISSRLVVTARIARAERREVSVDRHRPASTANQFRAAVGGAVLHAIKDRLALNV